MLQKTDKSFIERYYMRILTFSEIYYGASELQSARGTPQPNPELLTLSGTVRDVKPVSSKLNFMCLFMFDRY